MAYSDKVLDHYENPRNVGSFKKDDDAERRPERLWRAADAEAIVAACRGGPKDARGLRGSPAPRR